MFNKNILYLGFLIQYLNVILQSLAETMTVLCQVLTTDQDGGSALDVNIFNEMYSYLAHIDGDIPKNDIDAVINYVEQVAQLQDGKINQFNLQSECCPHLH